MHRNPGEQIELVEQKRRHRDLFGPDIPHDKIGAKCIETLVGKHIRRYNAGEGVIAYERPRTVLQPCQTTPVSDDRP